MISNYFGVSLAEPTQYERQFVYKALRQPSNNSNTKERRKIPE